MENVHLDIFRKYTWTFFRNRLRIFLQERADCLLCLKSYLTKDLAPLKVVILHDDNAVDGISVI